MGKKDFDRFVRQELADGTAAPDWAAERERWIEDLGLLYDQVRGYVADYVQNDQMTISERRILLNEAGLGEYEVPSLILRLGKHEVVLRPIGTNIIAARGAVEVDGSAGRARLVLVAKDADAPRIVTTLWCEGEEPPSGNPQLEAPSGDFVWKVAERHPFLRYTELDKDKFLDLFMEVVNA